LNDSNKYLVVLLIRIEFNNQTKIIEMNNVTKLLNAVVALVPEYLADPIDKSITGGHWAICIIDEANNVVGKMDGDDINRTRQSYKLAWIKASQVWITGYKTGEFEKLIYADKLDEGTYGIMKPDYVGWEGGQPLVLKDGSKLSVGFSGFRGTSDLEIVSKAVKVAGI
jgi:glc operon protein GlcG